MANKSEINKMLFAMSALPNCPIRNDNIEYVIDVYHLVLKELDWEALQAATAGRAGTAARVHNTDIPNHETTQLAN
jgi:hypothetical protein